MFKWIHATINDIKLNLIQRWIINIDDKHEILTLAVRKLFSATTERDILKYENGYLFYKDKALKDSELHVLKTEAANFKESKLWQVICTEIEWQANKRMYLVSKNEFDLIAGKIALFNLDVIKTVLNKLTTSK